ncbi:hypothetical protein AYI70_g1952 [Smittium culicis]|uniref:F-box domain-containing protein n=1 Tax=Smittium culicis TaxID=133412 RepID=A0A1R1YAB6_9FUNG|nr:hypothetical protein AYI70_g1952 [Smittium culicis]
MSLLDLPNEILARVFSYISLRDTTTFLRVSKSFFNKINSLSLWERKYKDDFGDIERYLELLQKAGIQIQVNEIASFPSNSNSVDALYNLPSSSSSAHANTQLSSPVNGSPYSSSFIKYKNRHAIVSNSYNASSSNHANGNRMELAAEQLSYVKQKLLDFGSNFNIDSTQISSDSSATESQNSIIEYLKHLAINEFPWEPECFHLLGFICYILGKNEQTLEFLSIGLEICKIYNLGNSISTEHSNNALNINMDIDRSENKIESISKQFTSNLSINEINNTQSQYKISIFNDIIQLYNQVKSQLDSINGTESDFPLISENGNALHSSLIDLLKITFEKFDFDKDGILNLQQLGKLVAFVNTPNLANLGSKISLSQLKSINSSHINSDMLLSMISKYDPSMLTMKGQSNGSSASSSGSANSGKKNTQLKKSRKNHLSGAHNIDLSSVGISFNGLCLFYLDQSLQDPEETRNDIEKFKLLI